MTARKEENILVGGGLVLLAATAYAMALVVHPDPGRRDPQRAAEAAEGVLRGEAPVREPRLYAALAQARAMTGRHVQAVHVATQGPALAEQQRDEAGAAMLRTQLARYGASAPGGADARAEAGEGVAAPGGPVDADEGGRGPSGDSAAAAP